MTSDLELLEKRIEALEHGPDYRREEALAYLYATMFDFEEDIKMELVSDTEKLGALMNKSGGPNIDTLTAIGSGLAVMPYLLVALSSLTDEIENLFAGEYDEVETE